MRYEAPTRSVSNKSPSTNPPSAVNAQGNLGVVDSLLHPLALAIRQLLRRSERKDLDRILIDDEQNILQALDAGVTIHSVFHSGEELASESLRQKLSPSVHPRPTTRCSSTAALVWAKPI